MVQGMGSYYYLYSDKSLGKMPYMNYCGYKYPNFNNYVEQYKKSQKVGFWEGLKAFGKGIIRPIKNIFKHPIKSALMIAGAAALIIGTGGAAAPLLVGAGLAMGGYQLIKGGYVAMTAKTKGEKLAALEDMGEGTFTVGASLAGARSYAKTTSVGSAVTKNLGALSKDAGIGAKAGAIAKGLGSDALTTVKAIPNSAQQTVAMAMSGEFSANLRMAAASSKLAIEHRKVADIRRTEGVDSKAYKTAFKQYLKNKDAFIKKLNKTEAQIASKYINAAENSEFMAGMSTKFNENGLVNVKSFHQLKDNINIFKNNPTVNITMGVNSQIGADPEVMQTIQTYGSYYGLNFSA